MNPIHILHAFHKMDCGGAESMIMNLYRNIDRSIVQFDFLVHSSEPGFFDNEIRLLGGNIYIVPYYKVINEKKYRKCIQNILNSHPEIKIVHGHVGSCAHVYLDEAKKLGRFTIAHSHNTKPELSLKSIAYRLFTYRTRQIADYFMACGEAAGYYRFGEKIISNKEKYSVLNNSIQTEKYVFNVNDREKIREEFGVQEDEILIGHVGRFNYQKNHEYLIEIFNSCHTKEPRTKLLLVGDGNLRQTIEKKVQEFGLQNAVIFAGLRRDVPNLLKGMDCFVFPSFYEGVPVTIVEAQAADLPCYISDKITREVQFSNEVTYIPLEYSADRWAEKILSQRMRERTDQSTVIIEHGYDIQKTVKWLTGFYVQNAH